MIVVKVDTRPMEGWLGSLKGQLPFATSNAINATLLRAQVAQQAHDQQAFKIRNVPFVTNAVKIKPFATKGSLFGTIAIDPPGGQARASVLTQHEDGGVKTPAGKSLWIPDPKGATPVRNITKSTGGVAKGSGWRPRELGLKPHGTTGRVWQGKDGIFLIRTGDGTGIVLQRTNTGRRGRASSIRTRKTKWAGRRSNVRVLYILTPNGRIAPRLAFHETVLGTINKNWNDEITKALIQALETAR